MGGVAYIDQRKLEPAAMAAWLKENVPRYFNYGDKVVSYHWNPESMAKDLIAHIEGRVVEGQ